MWFQRVCRIVIVLTVICVAVVAVSRVTARQDDPADEFQLYIGTVTDNENEFVGLAIEGIDAVVYICDGNAEEGTVSIAEWFIGTMEGNALDITAASGNRVEVFVDGAEARGRFTFTDGSVKEFVLTQPEGDSALYRSEFALGGVDYIAGWLVLPDGSTRGAVFNTETAELTPATFAGYAQTIEPAEEE